MRVCKTRLSPARVIISRPTAADVSPRWSRCGRPVPGETKAGVRGATEALLRRQVRARPVPVRPLRQRRGSAGAAGSCRRRPGERGLGFPSYIGYISELYFQFYGIYF